MRTWNPEPMYPPDSLYSLWYCPEINRFVDEDGYVLHDLSDRFDVWELDEWKKTRDYGILQDRRGNLCELFYPDDEEKDRSITTLFFTKLGKKMSRY